METHFFQVPQNFPGHLPLSPIPPNIPMTEKLLITCFFRTFLHKRTLLLQSVINCEPCSPPLSSRPHIPEPLSFPLLSTLLAAFSPLYDHPYFPWEQNTSGSKSVESHYSVPVLLWGTNRAGIIPENNNVIFHQRRTPYAHGQHASSAKYPAVFISR